MNRTVLLLLTAALLASCNPPSTPDGGTGGGTGGGTNPGPTPVVPAGYLPAAGAAPETGPGPAKVRISPTADDLALITYTNEFRTKGTVRGFDPTVTSLILGETEDTKRCMADIKWAPGTLRALSFNGVAHAAATKHALYLQNNGYYADGDPHSESNLRTGFTGTTSVARFAQANQAYSAGETSTYVGENALFGWHDNNGFGPDQLRPFHDNALYAVMAWVGSYEHCINMLRPEYTDMGASYLNPTPDLSSNDNDPRFNSGKIIGIQVFVRR